jgi:hypothetical protein
MTRPKTDNPKQHITATVHPKINEAIELYRNDERNRTETGDRPTRSWVIEEALHVFLEEYLPAELEPNHYERKVKEVPDVTGIVED